MQCPECNGDGYVADHSRDKSCYDGQHYNCPIPVQCEACQGTGQFLSASLNDDKLPF